MGLIERTLTEAAELEEAQPEEAQGDHGHQPEIDEFLAQRVEVSVGDRSIGFETTEVDKALVHHLGVSAFGAHDAARFNIILSNDLKQAATRIRIAQAGIDEKDRVRLPILAIARPEALGAVTEKRSTALALMETGPGNPRFRSTVEVLPGGQQLRRLSLMAVAATAQEFDLVYDTPPPSLQDVKLTNDLGLSFCLTEPGSSPVEDTIVKRVTRMDGSGIQQRFAIGVAGINQLLDALNNSARSAARNDNPLRPDMTTGEERGTYIHTLSARLGPDRGIEYDVFRDIEQRALGLY